MIKTIKAAVFLAQLIAAMVTWTGIAHSQLPSGVTPSVSGAVQQYLLNPLGEVDGLLLSDGTVVKFPPHLGTMLVATVHPGDPVTVTGFLGPATPQGRAIKALTITNTLSRQTVVDQPPTEPRPPKHVRDAALQSLTVSGAVARLLVNPKGDVDGLVLRGGELVKLKPHQGAALAARLQGAASPVTITGWGTRSTFGTVVEAHSLTVDGQTIWLGKGRR